MKNGRKWKNGRKKSWQRGVIQGCSLTWHHWKAHNETFLSNYLSFKDIFLMHRRETIALYLTFPVKPVFKIEKVRLQLIMKHFTAVANLN